MKKKLLLLFPLLVCVVIIYFCRDWKYIARYKYDSDNIFGLKEVRITEGELTLIFDKECELMDDSSTNPVYSFAKNYEPDNERYDIYCYAGHELMKSSEVACYIEDDKVYISYKCDNPQIITDVSISHDIDIENLSAPTLRYEWRGGDVIMFYNQEYDSHKKEWNDYQKRVVYG